MQGARAPYSDPECLKYRYVHAREQDTLKYLKNKYESVDKHIKIFPAVLEMFGQYNSKWIAHYGAMNKDERLLKLSDNFEKQKSLFFEEEN